MKTTTSRATRAVLKWSCSKSAPEMKLRLCAYIMTHLWYLCKCSTKRLCHVARQIPWHKAKSNYLYLTSVTLGPFETANWIPTQDRKEEQRTHLFLAEPLVFSTFLATCAQRNSSWFPLRRVSRVFVSALWSCALRSRLRDFQQGML